jgi:hypothetical protein
LGTVDVRLAAAGDIGTGGDAAYATTAAMDALEADREFDAVLLLGDNVYPSGEAELVGSRVLDPLAPVLDGLTELVAGLGNHEVRTGDVEPELAALGLSSSWPLDPGGSTSGPWTRMAKYSTSSPSPTERAGISR